MEAQERVAQTGFRHLDDESDWENEQPLLKQKRLVGELSGPAAKAAAQAGVNMVLQDAPIAGGRRTVINPIQAWVSAFEGTSHLTIQNVLDACDQAVGILREELTTVRNRERSPAGLVARFVRFPYEVREAAGFSEESSLGSRAAFGAGVLVQVVVTVVSGLLLAGAVQWLGLE